MAKETSVKDFFNKMPCICQMNNQMGRPAFSADDKIVRVELNKETYPYYTVYYFHRIYDDDRIYKCALRMKSLNEVIQKWCDERDPIETKSFTRWEGKERSYQLKFNI